MKFICNGRRTTVMILLENTMRGQKFHEHSFKGLELQTSWDFESTAVRKVSGRLSEFAVRGGGTGLMERGILI